MNVHRRGLCRLALASRRRESKMLFHQRNKKDVAARSQIASLSARRRPVAGHFQSQLIVRG
jgi:hypothetical protein